MNLLSSLTRDLRLGGGGRGRGGGSAREYKDPMGKFAFQYKVNVRRSLRRKVATTTMGSVLDFEGDFRVPEDYAGPRLLDSSSPSSSSISPQEVKEVERWFAKEELLHRKYVYRILERMETFCRQGPVLVDVRLDKDAKINICGDIHGQYYDLLKIMELRGPPTSTNLYLFNGDIVDKGPKSIECILLLFLLKMAYPNFVFVNRGNHESALVNTRNGFAKEIKTKYDDFFMFEFFGEVFRWLPVVHVISGRIMVVHGGLPSNKDIKLQDIRMIKRPVEPHTNQLVGDLLWSDPVNAPGFSASTRGIGMFFGPDVTRKFIEKNELLCIIRSHSEVKEGCGLSHESCYTVFSAPSKAKGILGGIMTVEGKHLGREGSVFQECSEEEVQGFKNDEKVAAAEEKQQ